MQRAGRSPGNGREGSDAISRRALRMNCHSCEVRPQPVCSTLSAMGFAVRCLKTWPLRDANREAKVTLWMARQM